MTTEDSHSLPEFVSMRIRALGKTKTVSQIARAAGFKARGPLIGIAAGTTRLPLDHALRLAAALECDARSFAIMALRQFVPRDLVDTVTAHPQEADVGATAVALAVELVGLRDDLTTIAGSLVAAQGQLEDAASVLERLATESTGLASRAR
jgi:hypothetical protein